MARPPLTEDQVRAKVLSYCKRHSVSPGPEGLPPFPAGKRETRQHREWLTVYRAHQRLKARAAAGPPPAPGTECPVCHLALAPGEAVPFARARRRGPTWTLHSACAELLGLAERAGPEAVARISEILWPQRARGAGR